MKKNNNLDRNSPIRKQIKSTLIERYGCDSWPKSETGRKTIANNVKEQWSRVKEKAFNLEPYSFVQTKALLEKDNYWQSLQGKAKNRTLLKENPQLYHSIYKHSDVLEQKMKECKRNASSYNFSHRLMFIVEKNGDIESLKCSCGKSYSWTGYCRHCSDLKNTYSKLSDQEKIERSNKQRVKFMLSSVKKKIVPAYDLKSIPIIELFAKEHGWKMQHAENGGEFCIKELGYWVDAYDPVNNIILEIDEPQHFNISVLSDRDQTRQKSIEDLLNCKFYRIYFNQRTGRVVLYHTPENRGWDFQKGLELSTPAGKKRNGTQQYFQYGLL